MSVRPGGPGQCERRQGVRAQGAILFEVSNSSSVVRRVCIRIPQQRRALMPHPVIQAEIRSADPDATRQFFADLFGWKVAAEGEYPGYTFIDTGVDGGTHVAISPRQGLEDEVLFFVAVDDVAATLEQAEKLG